MKVTLLLITLGLVLNSVQSAITMADLGKVLGSIVTGMALGTQTDKSKKTSDCYSDCKNCQRHQLHRFEQIACSDGHQKFC